MTLLTESTALAAVEHAGRQYRSRDELSIRVALEAWGRTRWPQARQVHELVMGRGDARADMAFVSPDDLVVVEIKSIYDTAQRMIHQCGMFSLGAPEVWICADPRHDGDVGLLRHLLPGLGHIVATRVHAGDPVQGRAADHAFTVALEVVAEPVRRAPHPDALLSLCWVAELADMARRHRLIQGGRPPTHGALVKMLRDKISAAVQLRDVCRALRQRQAFWRADPPVSEEVK